MKTVKRKKASLEKSQHYTNKNKYPSTDYGIYESLLLLLFQLSVVVDLDHSTDQL